MLFKGKFYPVYLPSDRKKSAVVHKHIVITEDFKAVHDPSKGRKTNALSRKTNPEIGIFDFLDNWAFTDVYKTKLNIHGVSSRIDYIRLSQINCTPFRSQ